MSDKDVRLPDFIIGGAPKCGTTSLHFILDQHPDVGIPHDEVHFFDADDPVAHPDFLFSRKDGLDWYDPRQSNELALSWYASRFTAISNKKFIGEDSTLYLQSSVAAQRIAELLPDVKIIFMLRHPVKRTYSHYWHHVTRGRFSYSFEEALTRYPSIVLGSTYTPNLRHYIDVFGTDRIRIGLFEDFLEDQQAFMDGLSDFLGLTRRPVDTSASWFNRTYYPRNMFLQKQLNRLSSHIVRYQYHNHFRQRSGTLADMRSKFHYRWFKYIHPVFLTAEKPPPMHKETKRYLEQHLSARNVGLSELLGRDLSQVWPGFQG